MKRALAPRANHISAVCAEMQGPDAFPPSASASGNNAVTKNALNKALEGLTFEMDSFTIHDQRRTGGTLLSENGWDENVSFQGEMESIVQGATQAKFAALLVSPEPL